MPRSAKLLLLTSLYLAQGMPFGFFSQFLPAMLRLRGVDLAQIGLASALALPWGLKFLWAPLVDRYGWARMGLRRTWIVPLQLATVATLVWMSTLDPTAALQTMLVGVLALNLLASTQDIAADGLAVTILQPDERGLGNGVQVAGYRLGMILCGGVLLILYDEVGWTGALRLMAAAMALTTLPILLFREPPAPARARPEWRTFTGFFRLAGAPGWLAAIASFKAGEAFGLGMLRPLLIDSGLGLPDIGWLTGTAGFIASLVGAMFGGALIERIGRYRSLILFGVVQALAVASYTLAVWRPGDLTLLYALCSFEHFASGAATVALFTMMMDATRPHTAGSDYTVQASVVVLTTGLAASLSGFSAEWLGYAGHFAAAAALCLLGLLPAAAHRAAVRRGETALAALP